MSVTPSDLFLQMEALLGQEHSALGGFCCVCGRTLVGQVYFGAGSGKGRRFSCKPCYEEATSPTIEEETGNISILDDHRIRKESEFTDDMVAYVEGLWGRKTYAFNVAVRNLEQMRRGVDDRSLREPQTYHEALHLVRHVRQLANDIARHFGVLEVRSEDDLKAST